jgi:hypothetical protein
MDVQVFDNYLPLHTFLGLKEYFTNETFPWFFSNAVKKDLADLSTHSNYNWQLYHMLYHTPDVISDHNEALIPLYNALDLGVIIKSKVNCNPISEKIFEHGMHTDITIGNLASITTTVVYYLNTNNGYTKFEDGTIVESVQNRLVKFPSSLKHTGSTCTDEPRRLVFNINYIEKNHA